MKTTNEEYEIEDTPMKPVPTITVFEAEKMLAAGKFVILDVRGFGDYEIMHIGGSIHIEFTEVFENLGKIPRDKSIGVICYGGGASEYITQLLLEDGYSDVSNIKGGIIRWALDINDSLLEYL